MQRELLLLREMRDSATAIRDLVEGLTADEIGADSMRRAAVLWHFTVLGELPVRSHRRSSRFTTTLRGKPRLVSGTASSTATGAST